MLKRVGGSPLTLQQYPPALRDLLDRLLAKDPSVRLGERLEYHTLKSHPFFNGINWQAIEEKRLRAPLATRD